MLSRRLPPHADLNALTRALATRRAAGQPVVDLTESNPTRAGFSFLSAATIASATPCAVESNTRGSNASPPTNA
jgi:hypothetical protein